MAAQAALKAGAGWVSVAPLSEFLAPPWKREFTYESFALEGEIELKPLEEFIEKRKVKAVLIGPGTMENPLTRPILAKLSELQKKSKLRIIIDAGALGNILDLGKGLKFDPDNTLLTPHPGEWQRLSKDEVMGTVEKISDLEPLAQRLSKAGFSAIYKSASPIVIARDRSLCLSLGDNRLARAGSGDILAGLILGLAATPHSLVEIAAIAQNMLARASKTSEHSLSPLEMLERIL
jgi:NAD(P)H-hydrate repair Nnr-like enzyme with NAD(P)H-hydrate dehydratase domain